MEQAFPPELKGTNFVIQRVQWVAQWKEGDPYPGTVYSRNQNARREEKTLKEKKKKEILEIVLQ